MSESNPRLDLLLWVAALGAVSAPALAVRGEVTLASARASLTGARRRGELARSRPLAGQPALYTLTAKGARLAGTNGARACRVSVANAPHLIACAAAAAGLQRCYPGHHVLGERGLRELERLHGLTLASAQLGSAGGEAQLHRPDLVLLAPRPDAELPVAVEVELALKAPQRLSAICRAWARCRQVGGVLYVASDQALRGVQRAIEQAHAGERIVAVSLRTLPAIAAAQHARTARNVAGDA
jgi:hypothetical protein